MRWSEPQPLTRALTPLDNNAPGTLPRLALAVGRISNEYRLFFDTPQGPQPEIAVRNRLAPLKANLSCLGPRADFSGFLTLPAPFFGQCFIPPDPASRGTGDSHPARTRSSR